MLRAEELDNLTVEQLLTNANGCFARAETTVLYLKPTPEERIRLLFEAQLYLTAATRKRREEAVERDRKRTEEAAEREKKRENIRYLLGLLIEVAVLGLISWEIIEGYKQADTLEKMRTSTAATASAMTDAAMSLKTMSTAQAQSLGRLNDMNDKLQASLSRTGTMASTTQKQLEVLQKEQADRLAQLAKKPKLALYIGMVPASTALSVSLPVREQTDTTITLDLNLTNEGDATANQVALRAVVAAKDVALQGSLSAVRTVEPADSAQHTFIIQVAPLHPKVTVPMTVTFTFPKGQAPFQVIFNVDADEIETGTPLGVISLTPRKPTS